MIGFSMTLRKQFLLENRQKWFTISNTKAEISHGSAFGREGEKGLIATTATWQIGSNGFAWDCPKKAAQDKYWQYKRWVSHVFS